MYNNLIEKYYNMINYLNETSKKTNDSNLKEFAKKSLIDFINGLYKIEKKNKELYENLFEHLELGKDNLIKLNLPNKTEKDLMEEKEVEKKQKSDIGENQETVKEPVIIEKIKDNIVEDELDNKLIKYETELKKIFENPNKESIKVWLKNIISYAKENNISNEELNEFIKNKFEEYDKNKTYDSKELLNEINNVQIIDNEENELNLTNEERELEKYVFQEIVRSTNEDKTKDFHYILKDTKENITTNNMKRFKEDVEGLIEYIDLYSVDRNKIFDFFTNYVKKTNKNKENETNLVNIIDDYRKNDKKTSKAVEEDAEPLKIVNVKKSFRSKENIKNLTLSALVGVVGVGAVNSLFGIALGIGTYYLYKRIDKVDNRYLKFVVEKCGLKLDENNRLIDLNDKEVTKEEIGRVKYNFIKRELSKLEKDKGNINTNYKKNRLTSMLINNKLVDSIKNKFKTFKSNDYEAPQLVKDIKLGMRKVK